MSDGGRTARFRCPDCGHTVIASVDSDSGDWLLSIDCEDCETAMDSGIYSYGRREQ